jgi:uncharacterized protein YbaP (TraB family)
MVKTLKQLLPFLVLSFVSTLFLVSCKGPKAVAQGADTLPDALLWKIERKDLAAPSYLFGTIHMIPQEDYFEPFGFDEAFEACDKVVFEIDLDEMNDMGALMGLMGSLMMNGGVTLSDLLSPAEYKEVADYFEEMGLPMVLLGSIKPMFLSMLAEINMDPSAMQSDDIVSYEMDMYERANAASMAVGGLETMEYQMSIFDSIPYKDQAMMLLDAVRSTDLESDLFDETVAMYKQQKIEAMVAMVGDADQGDLGGYEDILLNNRNRNWIPVMAKQMAKRPVFFAVGAGHLAGENGVIKLLRKEGYTLTPVSVHTAGNPKRI